VGLAICETLEKGDEQTGRRVQEFIFFTLPGSGSGIETG
jgi:hypothetical protein